jgi:hypothetical protein
MRWRSWSAAVIGLVVVLVLGHAFCASGTGPASKDAPVGIDSSSLDVVARYEFDPLIVDVGFGEARMTAGEARSLRTAGLEQYGSADTITLEYPRVVLTRSVSQPGYIGRLSSLKLLDAGGQVLKDVDLGDQFLAAYSTLTGCLGVFREKSGGEQMKYETISTRFEMFDGNGREVVDTTFKWGRGFHVAPNGNFVSWVTWEGGGGNHLYFYDSQGQLLGDMASHSGEYLAVTAAYSPTGQHVAVVFGLRDILVLFDFRGREIWRKDLRKEIGGRGGFASQLIFSPNEAALYCLTSCDDSQYVPHYYAFCFSIDGHELLRRDGIYLGRFSPSGDRLVLYSRASIFVAISRDGVVSLGYDKLGRQTVELFDPTAGTTVWKHNEYNVLINSADVDDRGNRVLCVVEDGTALKKLLEFDGTGALVHELPIGSARSISVGATDEGATIVRTGYYASTAWLADQDSLKLIHLGD